MFTAAARDVEEKRRPCSRAPRFRQHGIKIADVGKDAGVRRWIGAGSASDGRLIDAYDFVDMLAPTIALWARALLVIGKACLASAL